MSAPALAWTEEGNPDGAALIAGSSLGTTREMWAVGLEGLQSMRIIRFDHLGHGESQVPQGPYSMDQLAAAVIELMDHLGIERACYVGLSLGGAVGQWLAINSPRRIDRLALIATAPYFPTPDSWRERAEQVRSQGTESVASGAIGRWFTDEFRADHPDETAHWQAMIATTPKEGYAGCCEALASFDVRDELSRISAPTMAIAGQQDPSTTPEAMQSMAKGIPGCRLEVLEAAAHLVNVAQPEQVSALLAEHFQVVK